MNAPPLRHIILVRHGESEANAGGITRPDKQIGLSPRGHAQAQALTAHLPAAPAVWVSEMQRTHHTAAPYCRQHRICQQISPLLNEFSYFDHHHIAGLNSQQRRPLSQAYWERANPHERNGEAADTFAEFSARVDNFMVWCRQLHNQTILFGHGIWLGLLAWKILGFDCPNSDDMKAFRTFQQHLPMPNTAIYHLYWHDHSPLMQLCAHAPPAPASHVHPPAPHGGFTPP